MRSKNGRPLVIRLLTFGAEAPSGEVLQAQWRALGVDLQVDLDALLRPLLAGGVVVGDSVVGGAHKNFVHFCGCPWVACGD